MQNKVFLFVEFSTGIQLFDKGQIVQFVKTHRNKVIQFSTLFTWQNLLFATNYYVFLYAMFELCSIGLIGLDPPNRFCL